MGASHDRRRGAVERDMDDRMRAAWVDAEVFARDGEYPTRYVVVLETLRYDDDGAEHRRIYKIVEPGAVHGSTRELLEAGLALTETTRRRSSY